MGISIWQLLIILAIVLVLFGAKRLKMLVLILAVRSRVLSNRCAEVKKKQATRALRTRTAVMLSMPKLRGMTRTRSD